MPEGAFLRGVGDALIKTHADKKGGIITLLFYIETTKKGSLMKRYCLPLIVVLFFVEFSDGKEINWDSGQLITIEKGDTARCRSLKSGEIYGLFLYNRSVADHDVSAYLTWSDSAPPEKLTVKGTALNESIPAIALISGHDTTRISVSIVQSGVNISSRLEIAVVSMTMPTDDTGLNNKELVASRAFVPFHKFDRYYATLPLSWYALTLNNNITQFVSVQFQKNFVNIFIVNPIETQITRIHEIGTIREKKDYKITTPQSGQKQTLQIILQGKQKSYVWFNADSNQNSEAARISLQAL